MTDWFARPVLHVSSLEASLRFYVDRLGFTVAWRYKEDGRASVAQVDRGSCALIFSDQLPEKVSKGLMFISLNVEPETHEAEVAALDALRAEFEARGDAPQRLPHNPRKLCLDAVNPPAALTSPARRYDGRDP